MIFLYKNVKFYIKYIFHNKLLLTNTNETSIFGGRFFQNSFLGSYLIRLR